MVARKLGLEQVAQSEARFTKPRPDCIHPEYWTSTDSDSTEVEVSQLVAGFIAGLQPDYVLETGTAFGQTTKAIGEQLKANGHGKLVSLETERSRVDFSRLRCEGLPVEILEMPSLEFVPDAQIDFAFFDSLIPLRAPELRYFAQYMSPRAVFAFHDSSPRHALMRQSIEPLVEEGLITYPIYLPTPRGVAFARLASGEWS
jgi:hypothetical protein